MSADTKALEELADEIERFKRESIGKLTEYGAELVREEVPKRTHRLEMGVTSEEVDFDKMEGTIIVSARSEAQGARSATLHLQSGKTRQIKLRPTKSYNYAEVVALGNRSATLRPAKAKAFLIPVSSAPDGESYITEGGQTFIVRTSRRGMKANPYHERAAKRLGNDAEGILIEIADQYFQ